MQEQTRIQRDNADQAVIRRIWESYASAVASGRYQDWLALWTQDAVQLPYDQPVHIGLTEIEAANRPDPRLGIGMGIDPQEITVLGTTAYSWGTFWFELTLQGQETRKVDGKFLSILKKQTDGEWKISHDCFNTTPAQI